MSNGTISSGLNAVSYPSLGYKIAANLYAPDDFDPSGSYPGVVFTSPGTSVKEQSGAVYGEALSKMGYVVLVFDRIGFGESEGPYHQPIDIHLGTEALRDGISFIRSFPFLDRDRLFGLGVCVGSQQMAQTAVTDKRLKAIATISGMLDSFVAFRAFMDKETRHGYYLAANEARQAFFETGEMAVMDTMAPPPNLDELPEHSTVKRGQDYYNTPLGGQPTYPNYSSTVAANAAEYEFGNHATSLAPYLDTPFMGIVGELSDLAMLTETFYEACTEPKEYVVVPGKDHVDLYYQDEAVQAACDAMDGFFKKHSA